MKNASLEDNLAVLMRSAGKSYVDISRELKMNQATIRTKIFRFKSKIPQDQPQELIPMTDMRRIEIESFVRRYRRLSKDMASYFEDYPEYG